MKRLLLLLLLLGPCSVRAAAELFIHNAKIYSVDDQFSVYQQMAIEKGRILALGPAATAFCDNSTQRLDLEGCCVLPGLIDAHAHLRQYAVKADQVDLRGATSVEHVLERVRAKAASLQPGDWMLGEGWDQNDWSDYQGFPHAAMLDAIAPEQALMLTRVDYHAIWVNSVALKLAGITAATPDPAGGEILRDQQGNPTGILLDKAMLLVSDLVPDTPISRLRQLLSRAIGDMHNVGLLGHHDMMATVQVVELVKEMIGQNDFPYRCVAYYDSSEEAIDALMADPVTHYGADQLVIAGLKAFADGALGSRGAALLEPYSDSANERGLLLLEAARLRELADLALRSRKQIATHAIGDRAMRLVLDCYADVLRGNRFGDHRSRIEHAQVIAPEDMPRFARLGVIPSMQPTHCTSDYPWAAMRLGPERIEGAYAWRSLRDSGVILPLSSDYPVEHINPFHGIHAAITRQRADGTAPEGYGPSQRLGREEALRGFSIWAAYAAHMEDVLGSLEAGKWADFIVIDRDIMTIDPDQIRGTVVLQAYFAGQPQLYGPRRRRAPNPV